MTAIVRKVALFVIALALVAALWEAYKWLGPEKGGTVLGWQILPATGDRVMPHVGDIIGRLFEAESRTVERPQIVQILFAAWYSMRLALLALLVGTVVGIGLAIVMSRFSVARRAALPYLIASQTVPLIALAPIMVSWSARVRPFGWAPPRWSTVVLLGAFLAFFPIAVGTLRGLLSTPPAADELLRSYAAPWRKRLWSLQLPNAIPYMVPAFRLGASAAVVGVVVSEISIGNASGIGRLVLVFAAQATSDPAKVYTAVIGACLVGLVMAGLVAAGEWLLMRNRAAAEGAM